jgi:hypothetical protein
LKFKYDDWRTFRLGLFFKIINSSLWAAALIFVIVQESGAIGYNINFNDIMWFAVIMIVISFFKYLPQVVLMYKIKCTAGVSIWGFILDVVGGVFSAL